MYNRRPSYPWAYRGSGRYKKPARYGGFNRFENKYRAPWGRDKRSPGNYRHNYPLIFEAIILQLFTHCFRLHGV